MTSKLITTLSLGFVVLGIPADSIDGQFLNHIPLETEHKSSYPQALIPNSHLRVLIDPEQGLITSPQAIPEGSEIEHPLSPSVHRVEAQTPDVIEYSDGTLSIALDNRHLQYLSVHRCADSEQTECQNEDHKYRH